MLATLEVPEHDSSIIATTGQLAAIGTDLEGLHRPLMGFSHPYALPAVNIPPAQPAITASTEQPCPTRVPGQRIHASARLVQGVQARSRGRIPEEDFPLAQAPTPAGQPRPIGAPCHAHHGRVMPPQPYEQSPIGGVPHIPLAII